MNSSEWLDDDEQLLWRTMVSAFRVVERNIERSLRARTGMTFADFTLLIALHEVDDGVLHVDQICDRLKWNHPRALLHTNRLEKRGFIHTEEHGEDSESDYVVVLTGVGRHVFAEATPDYVDTVRQEVIQPLAGGDRETLMQSFQAVLGRE